MLTWVVRVQVIQLGKSFFTLFLNFHHSSGETSSAEGTRAQPGSAAYTWALDLPHVLLARRRRIKHKLLLLEQEMTRLARRDIGHTIQGGEEGGMSRRREGMHGGGVGSGGIADLVRKAGLECSRGCGPYKAGVRRCRGVRARAAGSSPFFLCADQ